MCSTAQSLSCARGWSQAAHGPVRHNHRMQAVILDNSSSADAVILLHHSAVKTKNIGKQFTQRWRLAKYKSKRVMHRWWYMVFREPWLSFRSIQTHWWQQIFNAACKAAALLMVCEHGGRTSTQRDRTTPGLEATQQKKNWSTTQLSIWVKQSLEMNGGNKTPVHLRGTEQACFWRGLHLDPIIIAALVLSPCFKAPCICGMWLLAIAGPRPTYHPEMCHWRGTQIVPAAPRPPSRGSSIAPKPALWSVPGKPISPYNRKTICSHNLYILSQGCPLSWSFSIHWAHTAGTNMGQPYSAVASLLCALLVLVPVVLQLSAWWNHRVSCLAQM